MVKIGNDLFFPDMSKLDYDYALVIENATDEMVNDLDNLFNYAQNECTYMTVEKLEDFRIEKLNKKLNESQHIL